MERFDTTDQAAFRAEARAWLEEHVAIFRREHGIADGAALTFDQQREWQRRLADGGWGAPAWPESYGGRGLGVPESMIWNAEKARAGAHTFFNIVGYGMAGPTIIQHGSDEQRSRYLPPMLRGDEVWCQLFSEPESGSDLASLRTRAVREGDEWVVNGQKVWSSGADEAALGILLARCDPTVPKHAGLVYLLCDMRAPGVDVRPLRQIDGGAHFGEVFLTDVRIPDTNRLGEPGEGWTVARTTLLHERMSLGGGIGDFALPLERLVDAARQRGIAHEPLVRQALVDVYAQHLLLDVLNARIVALLSHGRIPTAEGSVVKLAMANLTTDAAELGMRLGGLGADADIVRAFLLERSLHIGGGTDQVQRNAIAERVLGLPRDPQPDRDVPFERLSKRI